MRIFLNTLYVLCICTIFLSCNAPGSETVVKETPHPLLGSWEMKEIYWHTPDTTYSITKAQPGLFLLTPTAYSIMWTPTTAPRVAFEVLSKPTDDELKAGFRSIVFNSGSYEMTDSTLTTTAKVAKVPGFEGGKQFYDFVIKDNILKLVMVDETYPDGSKPEWFGKLKTEFVFKKIATSATSK